MKKGVYNMERKYIEEKEFKQKYNELGSFKRMAEFYEMNAKTISAIAKQYNIQSNRYGGARKHKFNEDYFEIIDTQEKAYWLGFIMADGCVYRGDSKNSFRLQINLAAKDRIVLEDFQKAIESDYKIQDKIINNCDSCLLKVNSTKMCTDLMNHGVIQRKSLKCMLPATVPDNLMWHFIRGYFDGDGCVSISQRRDDGRMTITFSICAGKDMCTGLQKYMPDTMLYSPKRNSDIFYIESGGINAVKNIYHSLYKNASIYLKRKKDIFDKFYMSR